MKAPQIIEVTDKKITTDNIEHVLVPTHHKSRYEVLKNNARNRSLYLYNLL